MRRAIESISSSCGMVGIDHIVDEGTRMCGALEARLGRLAEVKAQAAHRWCAAVNATSGFGRWDYRLTFNVNALARQLDEFKAVAPA